MYGKFPYIYHKKSTIHVGKYTSPMRWYGQSVSLANNSTLATRNHLRKSTNQESGKNNNHVVDVSDFITPIYSNDFFCIYGEVFPFSPWIRSPWVPQIVIRKKKTKSSPQVKTKGQVPQRDTILLPKAWTHGAHVLKYFQEEVTEVQSPKWRQIWPRNFDEICHKGEEKSHPKKARGPLLSIESWLVKIGILIKMV